jgi:hypothetical protein
MLFTNLVLLHDCNYPAFENNLWSRNSISILTEDEAGGFFL